MINKLKYATIADIGTIDLVFYNEDNKEYLIEFCRKNGISYLPSVDRRSVYKLKDDNSFQIIRTNDKEFIQYQVFPYDRIFDDETIQNFSEVNNNEIRFIVDEEKIRGVVHIVDYNNEFLQVEMYRAMLRFENNLRDILIKAGKTNQDMISWIKSKSENTKREKNKSFWQARLTSIENQSKEMESLSSFQSFYLREILQFAFEEELIFNTKMKDLLAVSDFRNKVAHNKDITHQTRREGLLLFNFNGLKEYVKEAKNFFRIYDLVDEQRNKINRRLENS